MNRSYPTRPAAEPKNHQVYDAYIKKLRLKDIDFASLVKRKLTSEHIQTAQYATKRKNNVQDTVLALGHIDTFYDLKGVPGFCLDNGQRKQSGVSGLVIPVRDYLGRISSLLIRNDSPKLDHTGRLKNKYLAFSSNGKSEGGKVQQTTHCPIVTGTAKDVSGVKVRVTEGVLKADIATALDEEVYCFGIHGLNIPKDFANVLEELEISELVIALDAGEDENTDMMNAKGKLIALTKEMGLDVYVETWDPQYGKGIDDVLAAGHGDKIKYATEAEIKEILATAKTDKPDILVFGGGLSDHATAGEEALINAGIPIYQRSEKLVTPIVQVREASKGRQTKIAVLHAISKTRMIDYLCSVANWGKNKDSGETYSIDPPPNVADTILNRFGLWSFPHLAGVIMTPTLRPDGSLLKDIGYDPATRLYLLDMPPMPEIPETPTRSDAFKSLELLLALLVDFPCVDDASRSVALSALMTPIIRGSCKVVPMHVVSAPTPGTGKSYLLDTASAIAIGQPCPIIAAGRTEEETEKRLGAALLTGQPILSIDNLNGDLFGDAVCQAIERPLFTMRILGESKNVTIESRSTLFANGNNIRLRGDITRRAIQCLMDAKIERPELREFKLDPVQTVLNDRGKYISAILTIVRAYIVAGKPDVITPRLASFEEWSDLVRSCLVWLDRADPLASMEQARSEDPMLRAMAEVFTVIWDTTEGQAFTSREIIKIAIEKEGSSEEEFRHANPALREALLNIAADQRGSYINAKRLGHWLSRHKGRVWNNLRLESKVDNHGHAALWWLAKISDSGSEEESGLKEHDLVSDDGLPM